jgi:hypothetical protein
VLNRAFHLLSALWVMPLIDKLARPCKPTIGQLDWLKPVEAAELCAPVVDGSVRYANGISKLCGA